MPQTYLTRHLTARESALVDKLALNPRYAKLVERLRPEPSGDPEKRRGRPPKAAADTEQD
jgi:hypothetical protein